MLNLFCMEVADCPKLFSCSSTIWIWFFVHFTFPNWPGFFASCILKVKNKKCTAKVTVLQSLWPKNSKLPLCKALLSRWLSNNEGYRISVRTHHQLQLWKRKNWPGRIDQRGAPEQEGTWTESRGSCTNTYMYTSCERKTNMLNSLRSCVL